MNINQPLSIMIKPSSSNCNLKCDYCFYLDESFNRKSPNRGMMNQITIESIVKKALNEYMKVSFIFQGGEPSLIGLQWYVDFIKLEKKYRKAESLITHMFQTNGVLIDENWACFFKENNFLVGVSYDGYNRIHDIHRRKIDGKKSSRDVVKGLNCLKKYGVDFNVLTVVTNEVAQNIELIYKSLLDKEIYYHQYIACLDALEENSENKWLNPKVYGNFLIRLFDLWMDSMSSGYNISIRLFNNFISILMGYPPEACDMMGNCSIQYVVEADGDIYPCDFYCLDDFKLGNINDQGFKDFDLKRDKIGFIKRSLIKKDECLECKYFNLCRGGCPRYKNINTQKFRFCESYKMLFDARLDVMQRMANQIETNSSK